MELLVKAVDTIGEHTNELAVEPTHAINVLTQVVPVIPQDAPNDAHWRVATAISASCSLVVPYW